MDIASIALYIGIAIVTVAFLCAFGLYYYLAVVVGNRQANYAR